MDGLKTLDLAISQADAIASQLEIQAQTDKVMEPFAQQMRKNHQSLVSVRTRWRAAENFKIFMVFTVLGAILMVVLLTLFGD